MVRPQPSLSSMLTSGFGSSGIMDHFELIRFPATVEDAWLRDPTLNAFATGDNRRRVSAFISFTHKWRATDRSCSTWNQYENRYDNLDSLDFR